MLDRFKNYYKRTEAHNIHDEIFRTSPEYQHYLLGVAQGIYVVYDLIREYENKICNKDLLEALERLASQDDKIGEYFIRLLNQGK